MTFDKALFRYLKQENVNKYCLIKDVVGQDIFKVKMKGKSFALNPLEEEQVVFSLKENLTEIWHKRLEHYHHQVLFAVERKRVSA